MTDANGADLVPPGRQHDPGTVNIPTARWPTRAKNLTPIKDLDANALTAIGSQIVNAINHVCFGTADAQADGSAADGQSLSSLFIPDSYWRDHLALSWELRTLRGLEAIRTFTAGARGKEARIEVDASSSAVEPQLFPLGEGDDWKGILFYIKVYTKIGTGRGVVRVVQTDEEDDGKGGRWKVWTTYTVLEELKGYEELRGPRRPLGVEHGVMSINGKNWFDWRHIESEFLETTPDVLIIGAGQAGLATHARLKMLGVPTLCIEVNDAVGDNWRKRYHQLVLHDPVWFDHMPYLPFPDLWPVYAPKDKLADYLESYAKLLELNVWTKTKIKIAQWDNASQLWNVVASRSTADGVTETRLLRPRHIVQATGHSGEPRMPQIPGMDSFGGDLLCHSSGFGTAGLNRHSGDETKKSGSSGGKKAVVVGSCNSSFDICHDYYEKGYDVTMVQRSSTLVISTRAITELHLTPLYTEHGPRVGDADLTLWSMPSEVFKAVSVTLTRAQGVMDAEIHAALDKTGFRRDTGPDGSGIFIKYLQRGGGYYFDVGTAKLIADGKIKVKQGREAVEVLPHGLKFDDGNVLEADEIVFATGYQNMRTAASSIVGRQEAAKLGNVWGFDSEGEIQRIARPSGHPGYWFMGGNLAICRYYSRLLALQIKARLEGLKIV